MGALPIYTMGQGNLLYVGVRRNDGKEGVWSVPEYVHATGDMA